MKNVPQPATRKVSFDHPVFARGGPSSRERGTRLRERGGVPKFIEQALLVSEGVFDRGMALVSKINPSPSPLVYWIRGSLGVVYWVDLNDSTCTCPARGTCKHLVAAAGFWWRKDS